MQGSSHLLILASEHSISHILGAVAKALFDGQLLDVHFTDVSTFNSFILSSHLL